MTGFAFAGTHVIADLYEVGPEQIKDEKLILGALGRGITRSGATLCGMQVKRFEPSGLTAIYLLAESHVSVHTYPESRSLFFDAFTCGDHCTPELILGELVASLDGCRHRTEVVARGDLAAPESYQVVTARHLRSVAGAAVGSPAGAAAGSLTRP